MAAVLAAAACAVTPVDGELRSGAAEPDHVCIDACDHIYADGGWKVILGHRHGPNCGHERVNGKWVKKPEPAPPDGPDTIKKPND